MGRGLIRGGVLSALAASLALFAVACGGSDKLTYDPEDADEIAHDAVLSESDLKDFDLELVAEDDFNDDELSFGDTETCKKIEDSIGDVRDKVEEKREGRARTALEVDNGAGLPFSVNSSVSIFSEEKIVGDTFKAYRKVIEGDDLEDCFREIFEEQAAGANVEVKSVDPSANVPSGGAARAFTITLSIQGQSIVVATEVYVWAAGNAGITLTFTGAEDDFDEDTIEAIVKAQVDNLKDAES